MTGLFTPATAEPQPTVAIVGAGPAGLIAAEILSRSGCRVTIYERMPSPARKFLMAGRGGLNLTHSEPPDKFSARYGTLAAPIEAAIAAYPPQRLIAWANDLGQETFVGSSGRVFPKSMKASPLLRAWLRRLDDLGVVLKTRHNWTGVGPGGELLLTGPDGNRLSLQPTATLLALGGASWPKLGSDGSWAPILAQAGIVMTKLTASNCGVLVPWSEVIKNRFAGNPLKRIAVRIGDQTERGDLVITRTGLEGGAIYALAPSLRQAFSHADDAPLTIDLKPDVSQDELAARLAKPRPGQSLSNILRKAARLDAVAVAVAREAGLPKSFDDIARHLKSVPLTITGLAPIDRAISTAGGVSDNAYDATFMLRKLPGVFIAGEMLDWDAPTGGFLLQAVFATGVAAAQGILRRLATSDKIRQKSVTSDSPYPNSAR